MWEVAQSYPWLVPRAQRLVLFRKTSFGVLKPMREFQGAPPPTHDPHTRARVRTKPYTHHDVLPCAFQSVTTGGAAIQTRQCPCRFQWYVPNRAGCTAKPCLWPRRCR